MRAYQGTTPTITDTIRTGAGDTHVLIDNRELDYADLLGRAA